MGKGGKGGSGGGQAPQVPIPAGLYQTIASTSGLGQYASGLLDPLSSMTNWAASLASGGRAGQIPSFASQATVAGPNTIFGGRGGAWSSSFDPTSGLITFTWPGDPSRSFQSDIAGARGRTDIPASTLDQWQADFQQHQAGTSAGGSPAAENVTQYTWQSLGEKLGLSPGDLTRLQGMGYTPEQAAVKYGLSTGTGPAMGWNWETLGQAAGLSQASVQAYQAQGANPDQVAVQLGLPSSRLGSTLGPFLSSAWNAIQAQQALPGQMAPIEQQTADLNTQATQQASDLFNRAGPMYDQAGQMITKGQGLLDTGTGMLTEATTGTGLFPSQAAYIEEIKKTGETESAAMLSKLGLSESTMSPALKEQADLAAAGKAGELIQGNIAAAQEEQKVGIGETGMGQAQLQAAQQQVQLSQASQKIALGAQALELGEKQAVFDMYTSIANESTAFQRNLWDEAMAGYGSLGNIIQTAGQQYGYSLSGYKTVVDALATTAQTQAAAQQASMQADSSATSGLFGALGKILGGVGGAVGGAAAAGGGSAGGITSIIGSVIGLVGSLFCWVAREVYGAESPKWPMFADWMQADAPRWLYNWYKQNGQKTAERIRNKPLVKLVLRLVMDMIIFIYA